VSPISARAPGRHRHPIRSMRPRKAGCRPPTGAPRPAPSTGRSCRSIGAGRPRCGRGRARAGRARPTPNSFGPPTGGFRECATCPASTTSAPIVCGAGCGPRRTPRSRWPSSKTSAGATRSTTPCTS
jgi:hypothetical protein